MTGILCRWPAMSGGQVLSRIRAAMWIGALGVAASGCGGGEAAAPSPTPEAIVKVAGDGQTGTAGVSLGASPTVEVRDAAGRPMAGVSVRFDLAGGGATTDTVITTGPDGRASVTWLLGPDADATNTLAASAGSATATFSATAQAPVAGQTYFGRNSLIEYIAGDLPLIISAPHGGVEVPTDIPDRTGTNITTVRDGNTTELARAMGTAFHARTGSRPHVIVVRLRRTKLDANREIVEAAQGNRLAERAWIEYHSFIEAAKSAVVAQSGTGFYIDLHGHGHDIPRLELGYMLTSATLALTNAVLDQPNYENQSSIRTLSQASPASFPELLRGALSLGALFEAEGYPAVPSPTNPDPGNAPYFNGGYNTGRHGSRGGGPISGVQLETHFAGVRDTPATREQFAQALVTVWEAYVSGSGAGLSPQVAR